MKTVLRKLIGGSSTAWSSVGPHPTRTLVRGGGYTPSALRSGRKPTSFRTLAIALLCAGIMGLLTLSIVAAQQSHIIHGDAAVDAAENQTVVAGYSSSIPQATWSLEGDDAAHFEISAAGVLTFAIDTDDDGSPNTGDSPNFEAPADAGEDNVYEVTVIATKDSETAELAVAVTVTDVGPAIPSGDAAVDVTENTTLVGFYTSEPGVMWSLKPGGDADDFTIANGVLSISTPDGPDYETPTDRADAGGEGALDNVYHVTVVATTGSGANEETAELAVTVTVINVGPASPTGPAAVDVAEGTTEVSRPTRPPRGSRCR